MEDESFDDPEVARILNQHFVAIKVDREARPDIDAIYMSAIHAMGKSGGWPLNVWVTPERIPFYGGTYFPPKDQRGRTGFPQLLQAIHEQYSKDPERLKTHGQRIVSEITRQLSGNEEGMSSALEISLLEKAFEIYDQVADNEWGGIDQRIKFPSSLPTSLLLHWYTRTENARALTIVTKSLEAMADGGMHDQLGGGFHRYSTDPRWLIPHFEKMLYDQALLSRSYTEAWQQTHEPRFATISRNILDYVLRELTAPGGGFYSASDADSPDPRGEMEEGLFFTWTPAEIDTVVGPSRGRMLREWYGVSESGDLDGRSVLRTWQDISALASRLEISQAELQENIEKGRVQLLENRDGRIPPLRDDKIIAGWNGLMISAFARAGFALDEERFLAAARRAASFILDRMRENGRLKRIFLDGRAAGPAFLSDYAFLIAGLLDLYEAAPDPRWLEEALALQTVLDRDFADPLGGYFRTANDHPVLLIREKPVRDGALPSGNSVACLNLLRLAALTGREALAESALAYLSSQVESLRESPTNAAELLLAADFALDTPKEILIIKAAGEQESELVDVLRRTHVPNRIVSIVSDGSQRKTHSKLIPLLRYKVARNGKTTAYVCESQVCSLPTDDPEIFSGQLRARTTQLAPREQRAAPAAKDEVSSPE